MRGISPLLAVIILIATTIAVGGILAGWLAPFIRTAFGGVETIAEKQMKCMFAIVVESVTTDKIIFSNPSKQPLSNVSIYADGTQVASGLSVDAFGVETQSFTRSNNKSVTIRGLCQDEIVVEGRCREGDACWE
jgi:flagellin-like protein